MVVLRWLWPFAVTWLLAVTLVWVITFLTIKPSAPQSRVGLQPIESPEAGAVLIDIETTSSGMNIEHWCWTRPDTPEHLIVVPLNLYMSTIHNYCTYNGGSAWSGS